jgi:hypothetical protein
VKTIKFFLVALALLVFVVSPLKAKGYNGSYRNSAKQKPCVMMGLDSEHAAELQKLKLKNEQNVIDLKAKIKKIHLNMKMELLNDNPDVKSLEELADKLALAKGELHKNSIRLLFEAKKVLPEKEWKLFLKRHMNMGCGMGDCSNHGMNDGRRGSMKNRCGQSMGSKNHNGRMGAASKGCKPGAGRKCLSGTSL